MPVLPVDDPRDPRVSALTALTDQALRRSREAEEGVYVAESLPVLERALAAGHAPISILVAERWADRVSAAVGVDVDVHTASAAVMEQVTGFDVHRGVIAAMRRPQLPPLWEILTGGTIVVLDGVTDQANIGAIFRAAAGLGATGVIVTERTGDPLYRRTVRVSMGTVFQVPWTRVPDWSTLRAELSAAGYHVAALALTDDAVDLTDFRTDRPVALVLGSEGDGLDAAALGAADTVVTIPMDGGVDSLNVAAASAIALWAVRARR